MRSIRSGGFWILLAVLAGVGTYALQGEPGQRGDAGSQEQARETQAAEDQAAKDQEAPRPVEPPPTPPPTAPDDKLELRASVLETSTLVVLADRGSPVARELVFRELRRRHDDHPLDLAHLLPLAALRGDEARRDDVRATGDWARRQIESHKDREILVEPILTLWFEHGEGPRGALLDVLDDLGRMRPHNVRAAREAFLKPGASYRLRRSILLLLPSVAEHALPMVVPLAFFRDEVVSGNPMTHRLLPPVFRIRSETEKPPVIVRPKPARRGVTPSGGFHREHLEAQIDALFEQIGAPALREMVRAYREFMRERKPSGVSASGWTIYDEPVIELAHLDVDLMLTMSLAMSHHERRLAAQALRELAVKSPDVERALRELTRDRDRLVREFAKGS